MNTEEQPTRRRCERFGLDDPVEFYIDADIMQALSVDVSQTGIRVETTRPLIVEMRIDVDGEREERRARLIWAARGIDGSTYQYGLEFLPDEDDPDLDV